MSRSNFTSMERNRRLQMVSGVQNALIMAGALYQQLLRSAAGVQPDRPARPCGVAPFLAQHDALPGAYPENSREPACSLPPACTPKTLSTCAP